MSMGVKLSPDKPPMVPRIPETDAIKVISSKSVNSLTNVEPIEALASIP